MRRTWRQFTLGRLMTAIAVIACSLAQPGAVALFLGCLILSAGITWLMCLALLAVLDGRRSRRPGGVNLWPLAGVAAALDLTCWLAFGSLIASAATLHAPAMIHRVPIALMMTVGSSAFALSTVVYCWERGPVLPPLLVILVTLIAVTSSPFVMALGYAWLHVFRFVR